MEYRITTMRKRPDAAEHTMRLTPTFLTGNDLDQVLEAYFKRNPDAHKEVVALHFWNGDPGTGYSYRNGLKYTEGQTRPGSTRTKGEVYTRGPDHGWKSLRWENREVEDLAS